MNLDIAKRKYVDIDSHSPAHEAEEHDPEIQVIVTTPAVSLRSILKPHISNLTENRSPPKASSHTNAIRAARTSSPSFPQMAELPIKERTKQPEISSINVPDAYKAGDSPNTPANQTITDPTQKTRRIKRALICEFDQKPQPNTTGDTKPENFQQDDDNSLLQLDPNQLAKITITNNPTGEQYLPLFSAIALKQKRRMSFAPMNFQHFSPHRFGSPGQLHAQKRIPKTQKHESQ